MSFKIKGRLESEDFIITWKQMKSMRKWLMISIYTGISFGILFTIYFNKRVYKWFFL